MRQRRWHQHPAERVSHAFGFAMIHHSGVWPATVVESRRELAQGLGKLGARVFPSGANFVLADFGRGASALVRRLARRGREITGRRRHANGCIQARSVVRMSLDSHRLDRSRHPRLPLQPHARQQHHRSQRVATSTERYQPLAPVRRHVHDDRRRGPWRSGTLDTSGGLRGPGRARSRGHLDGFLISL